MDLIEDIPQRLVLETKTTLPILSDQIFCKNILKRVVIVWWKYLNLRLFLTIWDYQIIRELNDISQTMTVERKKIKQN